MRDTFRETAAIAHLELTRTMRAPTTLIALLGCTTVLALGHWLYWRALPRRPEDDRLLGYAFVLATMIGLRFGFSSDRALGSERFLVENLVRPTAYFFGKFTALLTSLLILTVFAIITATTLSAGDWNHALWYSLTSALAVCLFSPILLLVELAMETRFPGPAVFVLFVVAVLTASFTSGTQPLIRYLAFTMERLDYQSLVPLAWRVAAALGITGLLYPLWRWSVSR